MVNYIHLFSRRFMRQLNTNIKKVFLLIISLQILNIGLFAQDYDVPYNELNIINSVTEYVAEIVLEKTDSFPEKHSRHNHNHHKHSHSFHLKTQQCVLFKHIPVATSFAINAKRLENKYFLANDIRLQDVIFDITPPPPKA